MLVPTEGDGIIAVPIEEFDIRRWLTREDDGVFDVSIMIDEFDVERWLTTGGVQ